MLGIRTPKKTKSDIDQQVSPTNSDAESSNSRQTQETNVRRSIGKWETGKIETPPKSPPNTTQAGPSKAKSKPPTAQEAKGRASVEGTEKSKVSQTGNKDRTAEARICLQKAKTNLGDARNLRGDIKVEVIRALDRLYLLVKEAEVERKEKEITSTGKEVIHLERDSKIEGDKILSCIEENKRILLENQKRMDDIKEEIERNRLHMERVTYASVTATPANKQQPARMALHSIVISSKDDQDTGEEVLQKVRKVVDAKEGWVKIEKIRKARDRKIIMGCGTLEEREKVKERIQRAGSHLTVEEVKNKDPLLIIRDVLQINSDEDVLRALRKQNKEIFNGLSEDEDRVIIKYRKKARNPHTNHIVVSVMPKIWKRALEAGAVHIDLQRVKVADQSPLVQCTRCLAYGHGKRFCKETADSCSHCGEHHLSVECADRLAGGKPACRNCVRAKNPETEHNAFSEACPVRNRWDAIARSTVAYC